MSNHVSKTLSVRAQITQQIIHDLYAPELRRLQQKLKDVLSKIDAPSNEVVYHYKGERFLVTGEAVKARGYPVVEMPPHIIPHLEEYLADEAQVHRDESIIKQLIAALLSECETEQDIRDALPECLIPTSYLSQYERTRPPGYPFQNNPRLHKQFVKYEDVIFQYAAAKLFY